MKFSKITALSMMLVLSLSLSACGNLFSPATPTVNQQAVQSTLDAMVTQKIEQIGLEQTSSAAAMTNTALALPTNTATITPEPTLTLTPLPTRVFPTATRTRVPATRTPVFTATPNYYNCTIVERKPSDGTKVNVGTTFDAEWIVQNSGLKVWEIGHVDLRYDSGTKMQTVADIFDVTEQVNPEGELKLEVLMKAPSTAGKYNAVWKLVMEGITMCTLPVSIEAVNP